MAVSTLNARDDERGVAKALERQILIDDDGPGIHESKLEVVFEPFVRVETSRSRQTVGVGLGLFIARELAQRQGGTLALSNRAKGGLRAEVRLPRIVAQERAGKGSGGCDDGARCITLHRLPQPKIALRSIWRPPPTSLLC
jgi:nitrogen-specific signal transduction histidine kinase